MGVSPLLRGWALHYKCCCDTLKMHVGILSHHRVGATSEPIAMEFGILIDRACAINLIEFRQDRSQG